MEIKSKLATSTAATITLASLANGSGQASTGIDNSSLNGFGVDIQVKAKTNAAGTSATGYLSVYLVESEDGTNYVDAFGGTNGSLTPINATLLGFITATANATTYVKNFDTQKLGITLPRKFAIAIVNNTGATLDATGGSHSITYTIKTVQTV